MTVKTTRGRKAKPVPVLGTNWITNLGGATALVPVALSVVHLIWPVVPGPDLVTALGLLGASGGLFAAKDFNKTGV
jgi:hypothetical protein